MRLNNAKILLLGATGFTAKLIADDLLKEGIGFTFSARDSVQLQELSNLWQRPFISMDLMNTQDLEKIPAETEFIINCAGPFNLYAKNLLTNIAGKKITYLDVSGEQSFVLDSYQKYESAEMKATFIHACAFESFIADALASALDLKKKPIENISSFYHFSRPKVSPGTRLSMQLVRHYQTSCFQNSHWVEQSSGTETKDIQFPFLNSKLNRAVFAPYPEIVFFAKKYLTKNASSYILMEERDVATLQMTSPNPRSVSEILEKHRVVKRQGPNEAERKRDQFAVIVRAEMEDGSIQFSSVEGFDTYGITASIVVATVKALMKHDNRSPGLFAPSEVVESLLILKQFTDLFGLTFGLHSAPQKLR